ncbi:hypothetical protein LguiA_013811 [Lonicera macranthoides]
MQLFMNFEFLSSIAFEQRERYIVTLERDHCIHSWRLYFFFFFHCVDLLVIVFMDY